MIVDGERNITDRKDCRIGYLARNRHITDGSGGWARRRARCNGYATLADFALAKLEKHSTLEPATQAVQSGTTKPGVVVGTIAYMSREQASGRPIDARSDIFSFGVVLYDLLAGKRPFQGDTDLETLQNIIHCVPFADDCRKSA